MKHLFIFIIITLAAFVFKGCDITDKREAISGKNSLKKISRLNYPKFEDDMDFKELGKGVKQSIVYLKKMPPERLFRFGKETYSAIHMINSMKHFLLFLQTEPSNKKLTKFIKSDYIVYKSVGSKKTGDVLFTGYYEPSLKGSLKKSSKYKFPVFGYPKDLIKIDLSLFIKDLKKTIVGRDNGKTIVPYYTRKEIEKSNSLENKADIIAWVNNRVDLFFLHIQGSGKIFLDNGDILNVHYHTTNGRPYKSIGKLLVNNGKILKDKVSMQSIRNYLKNNPHEIDEVLYSNSSFVFFKTEKDGPLGSLNLILTPGRSIALDKNIFPLAALAFIETKKPVTYNSKDIDSWTDCKRFVLNQDTGGAIKGPGRADIFWGNGPYAEIAAGHLQHTGKLYFLIMKKIVQEHKCI